MASVELCAGVAKTGPRSGRLPLRGLTEVTTLIWVYAIYGVLRNLATGSPGVALRHADQILHWERPLGIDLGQRIRDATGHQTWLTSGANLVYATHAVVPVAVLVALYRWDRVRYRTWRNVFVTILALVLLGYWLYPVMPPDILASSYHFVDTSKALVIGHIPRPQALVPDPNPLDVLAFSNPYAAMPSLHVAWALFASVAAWPVLRRRWLKRAALIYPCLMFAAVVLTGNHWILDGFAGCLTVVVAYAVVASADRARRLRHVQLVDRTRQSSAATGTSSSTS